MFTAQLMRSCFGSDTSGSFAGAYAGLWWVPAGHIPGIDEAKKRLAYLDAHGPTHFAFTFQVIFQPGEEFQQGIDGSSFQPCPAV